MKMLQSSWRQRRACRDARWNDCWPAAFRNRMCRTPFSERCPSGSGWAAECSTRVVGGRIPVSGQAVRVTVAGRLPVSGQVALNEVAIMVRSSHWRRTGFRIAFTGSAELVDKIERVRELLGHAIPSGELAALFERAVDGWLERESKRRLGSGKPRRRRTQKLGSRHVPLQVAGRVWQRDGGACTFVDARGRRCSERRFVTLEHRQPHALGGPNTEDNLCLLCSAHNAQAGREWFGEAAGMSGRTRRARRRSAFDESLPEERGPEQHHLGLQAVGREHSCVSASQRQPPAATRSEHTDEQRRWREARLKAQAALIQLGFAERQAEGAVAQLGSRRATTDVATLLRAALAILVPA